MTGAITATATAFSAIAANTAALFTVSSGVIEGVSSIAYSAATIGITTGITAGVGALFAPKIPDPTALQTPLKQAMAVRQSAFGRVRVSGSYALFAVGDGGGKNVSYDVLAMLDGKSNAVVSYYLNDDLMAPYGSYWWAPGATGKYGGGGSNPPNLVQIDSRLGLSTETAYAISGNVALWTSSHRGDGVTSMLLRCKQAKREDQSGDFPNGLPQPSAVIDAQLVYDPRDGAQTQGVASTYKFSDNPILGLIAYLTDAAGGMGLDYARFILPAISFWTAAADEGDGVVSTSGMHATLLDAAAAGDHKIFLADTTGLAAGVVISLPTETVTVSSLGGAGEVDFTVPSALAYGHTAGELAYWAASGQSARYRCAGTYRHDTAPGDVVKSILGAFDGWLAQRGDGALVVRSNTLYAPTVVLGDRHIVGYRIDNFLPDEQATNQLIVSYTDSASGFNRAEAGYVQDDADIAARGQVRSQELYLQWVPSAPQAIAVARAVLARATQPLRGVITCNLAGLAVMSERYVGLQISEIPALANAVVEVTGKVSIDLQTLQVSFPFVATGDFQSGAAQAICFIMDASKHGSHAEFVRAQTGIVNALYLIGATYGAGLDLAVVAYEHSVSSIVKRAATAADITAVIAFVNALTEDTNFDFDAASCLTEAKVFFDATDPSITARSIQFVWSGITDTLPIPANYLTYAAAAQAVIATMPGVRVYSIDVEGGNGTTYSSYIDNTPADGQVIALTDQAVTAAIEYAVFGTSSTPGAGYTLPPLAPPSGAPLQPLAAPTITSVTPVYPASGGGVAGARASIVVADPGGNLTWKVQWKLSADSVWTDAGSSYTATGTPLTILTGLILATGSVDFQVAYIAGAQVSPWSSTTTETIAAPLGSAASTSKSASFTTTADHNVYYVDTGSGAITCTLNATPALNEAAEVWDATGHAAANPITFAGNGNTIAGSSTVSNFIDINFGRARLIFDGTQWLMQ